MALQRRKATGTSLRFEEGFALVCPYSCCCYLAELQFFSVIVKRLEGIHNFAGTGKKPVIAITGRLIAEIRGEIGKDEQYQFDLTNAVNK